jgi:excisionase family DNA binding protein
MFVLTKKQVAARAQVTPRTIENWVKQGRCPAPFKLGKSCLWERDAITSWLTSTAERKGAQ